MDIFENIVSYFKGNRDKIRNTSPEGTCPVCWGHQQYDSKIREILKDKQIDINNHKDSYMLIQNFMKQHIDGITLKQHKVSECPTCSTKNA